MFKKKDKSVKIFDINQMGSTDVFRIMINKLVNEGNYNKAEDLIFDELEKNNSPKVYEIATEFYNSLLKKSDELLNANNFTREEIYQGIEDIEKLKVDL